MTKIGIDIDDTLSETVRTFLDFYNSKHGTSFIFDEITDYLFSKQFGISPEEERLAIAEYFQSEMAINSPTLPGSIEAVRLLAQENELYAVSSRPTQLMPLTSKWIEMHYTNCFTDIILTNSHLDSTKTKSDVCKNLKLDIFIDDHVPYAEDCACVCSKVFLMDKPWNKNADISSNIHRVNSWAEVTSRII